MKIECNTCWGTGFYHGHGGPCSAGCPVPVARVGIHLEECDAPVAVAAAPPVTGVFKVGDLVRITYGGDTKNALTTRVIATSKVDALASSTKLGQLAPSAMRDRPYGPSTFWFEHTERLWPCDATWPQHRVDLA